MTEKYGSEYLYFSVQAFKIILGSSSIPHRKTLAEMGYEFTIMADAILSNLQTISNQEKDDEQTILTAADTVCLAFYNRMYKAEAILQRLPIGEYVKDAEPTLLITCDQVVVYEGVIREKPSSKEEAWQFWKDYSGGHAATVGSVLVTNLKTGFRKGEWDRGEVYFHTIPDEIIEKLIEEGTVLYVAGGVITEHPLILPFIKQVAGTIDSVMGLPKALTENLIKEAL